MSYSYYAVVLSSTYSSLRSFYSTGTPSNGKTCAKGQEGLRFTAFITSCPQIQSTCWNCLVEGWASVKRGLPDQPMMAGRWSIPSLSRSAVHYRTYRHRTTAVDDWFGDTVPLSLPRRIYDWLHSQSTISCRNQTQQSMKIVRTDNTAT